MKRIAEIVPADKTYSELARERWNSIAKPIGSFGLFEDYINKIAAVQRTIDIDISKRTVVVMCADNGVVSEGVTQTGSHVTALCAEAISKGKSNINALAEVYDAEVMAVDIGIAADMKCTGLLDRKVAYGTHNIAEGAAMSSGEAEKAICVGMDIVCDLKKSGTKIIVTGEMGIGNTTTAAALSSVLLDMPAEAVTGRGAGLTDDGMRRKISVVERAVEVNKPYSGDPVELLSKLGGFDIAGITGLFLGGAVYGIPVIIDGVISAAAAVIACEICPACADFMLAGHISSEPAGRALLKKTGLEAAIDAGLRLGEGTGGIMLLPLLDGAAALYRNSHRFEDIGIERYEDRR